ncbi:MAG: hypothetical protein PHC83_03350 [Bacteroidales bacterium]|nr:hypothetical protein [Bacteroidales bacterium]
MKIVVYCIIILFISNSCENSNKVLQKNNLNDTISLYSIEKSKDTMRVETRNINDSIYEQRRKERIDFCVIFMDALKSKELKNIEDKIEFPLSVECFVTKEKGKVIDKKDFILYFDSIFDDSFYKEMDKYMNGLKNSDQIYDYQIGYDLRDSDFFVVGSNYFRQIDSYNDEYSILFRFEKRKGKYKLILVFCAG